MLRLHHAPMACSLASRFALAESDLPHEIAIVRIWEGEQNAESYRRINPRGKVPTLETDEGVITESPAILSYIADLVPTKNLLPKASFHNRARALSWLCFLSSSVHTSLSAVLNPLKGADGDTAMASACARVSDAFKFVDTHLEGRDHVLDDFSVCDLYLTVFSLWRAAPALSGKLPAFANVDRLQKATLARPGLTDILTDDMKIRFG